MPELTPTVQSHSTIATILPEQTQSPTSNGDKFHDVSEKPLDLDADPFLVRFSANDPRNPKACQLCFAFSTLLVHNLMCRTGHLPNDGTLQWFQVYLSSMREPDIVFTCWR